MDIIIPRREQNEDSEYQTLGKKVFWFFFVESIPIAFAFFVIFAFPFLFYFQPTPTDDLTTTTQMYSSFTNLIIIALCFLVIIFSLIIAWPNYKNSKFAMGKFAFKIKRGIFEKTINTFPYKLMQGAEVKQGPIFKIFGLSRLYILTGQSNEKIWGGDDFDGIISAVDQNLAISLRDEIIKKITEQKAPTP